MTISLVGLGACLSQQQEDGTVRPLAFISRTLTTGEKSYASSELECAAVIYALKKFRHYCLGSPVLCITDNSAVSYIMKTKTPSGRLARWSLLLQDFNIVFKHRPGTENHTADCLLRAPINALLPNVPPEASFHRPEKSLLPTKTRMVDEQNKDEKLGPIIAFKTRGELPKDPIFQKKVEREASHFVYINGLLYKLRENNKRLLAIPRALVPTMLFAFHESMFSNHPGAAKMVQNMSLRYYWENMAADAKAHAKNCLQCQRRKPLTRSMEPKAGNFTTSKPYELISMDLQELPVTEAGHKHLLVIVDFFSHYVEAVPLKDKSAAVTANAFMSEWVCRHGVPEAILTDNAPNFVSPDMKKLFESLNVHPVATAPYSPNQNGRVEKMNHMVQEVLAMLVDPATQNNWDEMLPYALFSLRNRVNSTTGLSPFYILHGFDMSIPIDRALAYDSTPLSPDGRDYTEQIQRRLQIAWKKALDSTEGAQLKGRERHDASKTVIDIRVGDVVLPKRMHPQGPHMKLGDQFSVPHVVRKVKGGMLYLTPQHWDEALVLPIHQRHTKLLCRREEVKDPPPPPLPDNAPMVTPASVDPNLEEEASEDESEKEEQA